MSQVAPHTCPECGEDSYLGFGVPARCINTSCRFFDESIREEWLREPAQELSRLSWEEEKTDPGFAIAPLLPLPVMPKPHPVQGLAAWLPKRSLFSPLPDPSWDSDDDSSLD